jgi:UDP-N-acetyl-alpha-D-muramoyl-L-alanyl-L-glutamate epimerase
VLSSKSDTKATPIGDALVLRVLDTQFRRLSFPALSFDPATGVASFPYALDGLTFTETVTFPMPQGEPPPAFGRVLELLHLVAGVSYFKVGAPPEIVTATPLSASAVALLDAVYTKGMSEYAYRNNLPHVLSLGVSAPSATPLAATPVTGRPLSAVGGGKDSIVTLEALRAAGMDPVPFAVNPNWVIDSVFEASGLTPLAARRRIDPQLFDLNAAGALNGHIPVTAINSLIAVATAVLHGLGPVVMSNERSASDPNLVWQGHEINHQWSKGVEAEGLLREALAAHAGLADAYFSLLRPLSELHIARLFAPITAYDHVVTSCNAAFKLRDPSARWCGHCPKCRFVFLALAPFMPRARLVDIFGTDLLADPSQVPGYLELLGLDGHKPFECVGEIEESLVALSMLRDSDTPVVAELIKAIPQEGWAAATASGVFLPGGEHHIPERYLTVIDASPK